MIGTRFPVASCLSPLVHFLHGAGRQLAGCRKVLCLAARVWTVGAYGAYRDVPCRTGVMWAETSAPLSDISLFCISLSDYLSQHVTMLDRCLHAAFSVFPAACAEMGGLLEALPYLWRGPLRPRSNQDFAFARRLARCNAVPCLRSPKILQF